MYKTGQRHYPPSATVAQLKRATTPAMTRVAPHLFAPDPAVGKALEFSLGKFVECQPGRYQFQPVLEHFVRVDSELLKLLGIGRQWGTLCRLARAGFVEMVKIAPCTFLLNLDSYYNHVRRCAEAGPEFWEHGRGNLEAYREAL
jgi:hypothetical protein